MGPSANETQVWEQKNAIGYFLQWICIYTHMHIYMGYPGGAVVKNLQTNCYYLDIMFNLRMYICYGFSG